MAQKIAESDVEAQSNHLGSILTPRVSPVPFTMDGLSRTTSRTTSRTSRTAVSEDTENERVDSRVRMSYVEPDDKTNSHHMVETSKSNSPDDMSPPDDGNTAIEETYRKSSGTRIILLLSSVFASSFLVGLDRNILSTAIPKITDEFNSTNDVGWYSSAFTLTCCASQLLVGKFYTFYSVKTVYLISVLLLEVGSAVSGSAASSIALIIGRAIAGLGASGIYAGCVVCIMYTIPLEKRPILQSLSMAIVSIASIAGPLIGGSLTSKVSWRWCFYINLPLGGTVVIVMFFCMKMPDREETKLHWKEKIMSLDLLGTPVMMAWVICLLLALAWGGQTMAWSSAVIIVLFVLTGVFLCAFIAIQALTPKTATIAPRILKQRSVISSCWTAIFYGGTQTVIATYIPMWFQTINSDTAITSGVRMLPTIIAAIVASILFGFLVQKIGYYTPFAIFGSCLTSIGAGLLTTVYVSMKEPNWIGYQILLGFGQGLCSSAPNLAVQAVLPTKDVPLGSSLVIFVQLLGSTVFASAGENIFYSQLISHLTRVPGFTKGMATSSGATTLIDVLPVNSRPQALTGYNEALRSVFYCMLALACLTILGTVTMEWKSILKKPAKSPAAPEEGQAEEQGETDGIEGVEIRLRPHPRTDRVMLSVATSVLSDSAVIA
ncbi:mfs aflatoxin efflux [Penicillium chermesinum]|uniref:Mfs aflatoxin efflux n=1 Tax=Penicillium chermesinum TaxID=63820 RepID=A0A9W9P6F0_9EURO|nr:mfs aflatoxin efflux [Penicillium chermesinum]KAJ5238406.1 mfs aflatoxin efflux [Penicillium chermesinum]KAJ6164069.1 mfs aflatoxin efflux [Penicillium chermesinum]